MKLKYLLIGLLSFFAINICALAVPIKITCPGPASKTWNFTEGTAFVNARVSIPNKIIQLHGDTTSTKVKQFVLAQFSEGTLLCYYQGNKNQFAVFNANNMRDLQNCRFVSNPKVFKCSNAIAAQCILKCDYLGK